MRPPVPNGTATRSRRWVANSILLRHECVACTAGAPMVVLSDTPASGLGLRQLPSSAGMNSNDWYMPLLQGMSGMRYIASMAAMWARMTCVGALRTDGVSGEQPRRSIVIDE